MNGRMVQFQRRAALLECARTGSLYAADESDEGLSPTMESGKLYELSADKDGRFYAREIESPLVRTLAGF